MRRKSHIVAIATFIVSMLLVVSCKTETALDKFSLSCGQSLTLREGDTDVIEVVQGGAYTIETGNDNVLCIKDANNITVKAVKVGSSLLTVTAETGEKIECTIVVEKSAAQKDFQLFSNPRIENWKENTVYVDKTIGMQVTYEHDTDVTGYYVPGNTTLGYYFIETGEYCRLSALTDFRSKGIFEGGIVAIGNANSDTHYYVCECVEVVKVHADNAWVIATMNAHADVRIVIDLY